MNPAKQNPIKPGRTAAWTGLFLVLFSVWIFFAAGCNNARDNYGPLGPNAGTPAQASIFINPKVATLNKTATLTLTATGGTSPFTWSVSDPSIATIVSSTGVLTADNKAGTVIVTATDSKGASGVATVTVAASALTVTPASAQVKQLGTQTFTSTGTAPVAWTLSNSAIGTIGATTGAFTASAQTGSGTVTATDARGDVGTATVQVTAAAISVSPSSFTVTTLPTTAIQFTASGALGTVTFTLSGAAGGYTGATIVATTGAVTIAALPTALQGIQTLTITASDGIATSGTATLTVNTP